MRYKLIIFMAILFAACGKSSEQNELQEIAAGFNKKCPGMLNSGTRADKVALLPNRVLESTFTLVKLEKEDTDTKGLQSELIKFVTGYIKNDSSHSPGNNNLKFLKDHKVIFKYIYLDNKGKLLAGFRSGRKIMRSKNKNKKTGRLETLRTTP